MERCDILLTLAALAGAGGKNCLVQLSGMMEWEEQTPERYSEVAASVNRSKELVPSFTYSFPNPPSSLLPAWLYAEVELGLGLCLDSVTADLTQELSEPTPSNQQSHSLAALGP